jgi:RNA polymerase sigma-70 factor (ECF subfamily)
MNNDKEHQFERLVRQHKRTIYTVCYLFSHDNAEVDDLFQEILIRMWNGFDSYEGRSDARTWIYRVAFNAALNWNKKQRRRIETVPLTVDIDPYEANDPSTQQIRELYDRISHLDLVDRSLILLWLEGVSYEEIGAIVGITASHVGVRLLRIKDKLVKMSDNK